MLSFFEIKESDEPRSDSSDEENSGKSTLEKKKKALIARFSRDAFRTSLSNRPEMFVWMEAQERQEEKFKQVRQAYWVMACRLCMGIYVYTHM